MKLFGLPGACSTADHIALQWTGQPFEAEGLSLDMPRLQRMTPRTH